MTEEADPWTREVDEEQAAVEQQARARRTLLRLRLRRSSLQHA